MINGDFCLKVAAEFFGYLTGKPVLPHICLQKNPEGYYQQQKGKQNTLKYFKGSPQGIFNFCKSS